MKLHISRGNSKIGKTLNVSLPPIKTCRKSAPCAKDCYANNHAYRLYPGTRNAWDGNLALYKAHPDLYWFEIFQAVKRARTFKMFRWHVGGDIPDMDYLLGMLDMASRVPKMQFLCFTKKYELLKAYTSDGSRIPKNLRIIVSRWPGLAMPKELCAFPQAWMADCNNPDLRIPRSADECPGACEACGLCWKLTTGDNVVFNRH